jgi:hypothetical protein
VAKLLALPLPPHVREELAPLVTRWAPLDAERTVADARLLGLAKDHPVVLRLRTMPASVPLRPSRSSRRSMTSRASTAPTRCRRISGSCRASIAPAITGSGGTSPSAATHGCAGSWSRPRGASCAPRILRSPHPALAGLKAWALQLAQRRGKRIAVVALARRVAGILYAMWRDDATYQALPMRAVAA